MSDETEKTKLATVVWEGDSREVLRAFPEEVTQNLGFELWQLQQGEMKSREMPRNDFEKARQRFKAVKARLTEEKKREKRS